MNNLFSALNDNDIDEIIMKKTKPTKSIKSSQTIKKPNQSNQNNINTLAPQRNPTDKDLSIALDKYKGNADNWGDMMDAIDSIHMGVPNVLIVNLPKKEHLLPQPIALVYKYQDENQKIHENSWIIRTIEEMWNYLGTIDMLSAIGCNNEKSAKIFDEMIKMSDDVQRKKHIEQYNLLFPSWTIIKLPINHKNGDLVPDPFIRENDRAKNVVNINLKQSKEMTKNNLNCFKSDYSGFIPTLLFLLVGNNLPSLINAITFNQNVIMQKTRTGLFMYKGWRLRLLATAILNPTQAQDLRDKFGFEGKYIDTICKINGNNNYNQCMVNVTTN